MSLNLLKFSWEHSLKVALYLSRFLTRKHTQQTHIRSEGVATSVLMAVACVHQASAVFIVMRGSKTRAGYHIITVRRSNTPPGHAAINTNTQAAVHS